MDFLNPDSLALFLAEEAPKGGLLSNKLVLAVIALVIIAGGIYWYRSRGAK